MKKVIKVITLGNNEDYINSITYTDDKGLQYINVNGLLINGRHYLKSELDMFIYNILKFTKVSFEERDNIKLLNAELVKKLKHIEDSFRGINRDSVDDGDIYYVNNLYNYLEKNNFISEESKDLDILSKVYKLSVFMLSKLRFVITTIEHKSVYNNKLTYVSEDSYGYLSISAGDIDTLLLSYGSKLIGNTVYVVDDIIYKEKIYLYSKDLDFSCYFKPKQNS